MNLNELKQKVDALVEDGDGERTVVITLSQRSVGARAAVGIQGIFSGIDWEAGQLRIEPLEPICQRGRAKDDQMDVSISDCSGQRKIRLCPVCEERVKKGSNYCANCGQRLHFASEKME